MKGTIITIALAIAPSLAMPITDQPQGNVVGDAPFTVSRAALPDQDKGIAWLFTATEGPKSGSGTTLKFYQRNDLVKSGNGEAWVLELGDSIDTKSSGLARVATQIRPQPKDSRRGKGIRPWGALGGTRAGAGLGAGLGALGGTAVGGGLGKAGTPDQLPALPDIGGILGGLPISLPSLPALPDLSSIPVIGGLLGGGGASPAAAPAPKTAGGGSIAGLTTQIGEQIGERVGEPIGSAIGSRIGKAVGAPIGSTIGGAIGNGIQGLLPA